MRYMGGKTRQARHLSAVLAGYRSAARRYVEPFMGGAAVLTLEAPFHRSVLAADVHPDLVLMWQAILDGWVPPDEISRDEYNALKTAQPSALRGFAGFGLSFGGKWFGGYADTPGRDYCRETKRSVLKRAAGFRHARLLNSDYRGLDVGKGDLVYCDPPYSGTTEYPGAPRFDSAVFWARAREWAEAGAVVLVSEYNAPEDALCIWERGAKQTLRRGIGSAAMERLFAVTPMAVAA